MTTTDDVRAAVLARWAGSGELPKLVPGGLWFGRVPPEKPAPYATFALEVGTAKYTSGRAYLQDWTLRVSVWADEASGVSEFVQIALAWAFDWKQALFTLRSGKVIGCRPLGPSAEQAPEARSARDVLISHDGWELTVQGDRGVR